MREKIKTALLSVVEQVKNYYALNLEGDYAVYGDDGEGDSEYGDNRKGDRVTTGTIDFFTRTANDPRKRRIENALDAIELSYTLNSVQYETDTGYFHYEWVYEYVECDDDGED